ncbi:MAG TPA: TRAP transporter substrate-binding protein [Ramlibacter sp.]|uniref:TRAP transporter substrate-binding protein n=1 Tax=Ramlibacter sp. TaxID=1917967 RepID=UPI002D7E9962|nr:TRAP transporter substrate-binding protein [Ramlibacter sp.]HET8746412.1 TRAP transporter substrate-binding protein [Ramlibacter sp.]
MKERIRILVLAAGLAAAGAHAQNFPKTHLNVVGNLGITTQSKELEAPMWNTVIPKATGGQVTAQFKPWNEMGLKGGEVIKLLRQGLYDVGTTQLGFLAGEAAINDAIDLAGVSPTIDMLEQVKEAFRPHLAAYYEKQQNVKVLGLWSFQDQVLYCRNEFKGLSDLKGRKVRVSGASQADFIEYFGGSGVNMAFGEVQQALQNGVLDCAITGTLGGYKAKWYEGAKYLYRLPINWASAVSAASLKSWNKLDASVQKVIGEQYRVLEKQIHEQNVRESEIGIACNTGKGACPEGPPASMILVPVKEGDLELRRKALLEQVLPRWASRCGEACVKAWNESAGKVAGLKAAAK